MFSKTAAKLGLGHKGYKLPDLSLRGFSVTRFPKPAHPLEIAAKPRSILLKPMKTNPLVLLTPRQKNPKPSSESTWIRIQALASKPRHTLPKTLGILSESQHNPKHSAKPQSPVQSQSENSLKHHKIYMKGIQILASNHRHTLPETLNVFFVPTNPCSKPSANPMKTNPLR